MEPQTSRSLYEDVELAMAGYGSAICVARASLDTTDSDETNHAAAVGTMFSVKAKEDIEILGFEFLDLQFDAPLDVQIFMLKPKYLGEYEAASLEKDAWENVVSSSTAKETPEGVGAIVPRADMKKTIPLLANQVASFYFTLKSPHLQLSKSENLKTGQMYSEDGGLRVDVGIGLKDVFDLSQTDFFDYLKVANRAFQGKIHYHAIKDCSNFMTSTQIDLLFAYNATASSLDVSQAISDAFRNVLEEEPRLKRMMDQHKLEFESIDRNTSQVPFQGK